MDESRLKNGAAVLALGVLALSLSLAFPHFGIEWLLLVAAYASLRCGLAGSLALAAGLAWWFAAFSLSPAWQIFAPIALAVTGFHFLRARLNAGAFGWQLFLLLLANTAAQCGITAWYSGENPFSWQMLVWPAATWIVGVYLLPGIKRMLAIFPIGRWSRKRGGFDIAISSSRPERRPFGYQRGI